MKTVCFNDVKAKRARRAFTLIEIMITVAIMGLVLTMGAPPFVRALRKEGMRKALSDLTEACDKARADAVLNSRPSAVDFQPHDRTFHAPKFSSAIPPDVDVISLGVNFVELSEADSAKVVFYPNGISDEFEITLRGKNGEMRQVYLDIVTGTPQVKEVR